jgi:hypothetical protein
MLGPDFVEILSEWPMGALMPHDSKCRLFVGKVKNFLIFRYRFDYVFAQHNYIKWLFITVLLQFLLDESNNTKDYGRVKLSHLSGGAYGKKQWCLASEREESFSCHEPT